MGSRYKIRCRALCNALRQSLPPGCSFEEPDGGYFVWVHLPASIDADALLNAAKTTVRFQPGVRFSASGGSRSCLRLCFARLPEAELLEGAERLGKVLTAFMPKGQRTDARL